jgi:hypothetical protein
MDRRSDGDELFERRARELFDASVESLDARTRSRLNVARHSAIAELETRAGPAWASWARVLAIAGIAALAVVLWPGPGGEPGSQSTVAGTPAALDTLELVVAGEDLDLVAGDLDFYAMLEELELELASGGVG